MHKPFHQQKENRRRVAVDAAHNKPLSDRLGLIRKHCAAPPPLLFEHDPQIVEMPTENVVVENYD